MLYKEIIETSEQILSDHYKTPVAINSSSGVGGGCINDAHRLDTTSGRFFVKYNNATRYPGMFEAEARGLNLLTKSNTADVPKVIGFGDTGRYSLLVLEHIDQGKQAADFWEHFGVKLAAMHKNPAHQIKSNAQPGMIKGATSGNGQTEEPWSEEKTSYFGLDHDNYIGSLPQSNRRHHNWINFFVSERIEAQLKRAIDEGRVGNDLASMFEKLYRHLPDFFPDEPPALLHGDLWSGNYMCGGNGKAVIIDPAVYYGHRYMDLGMSKLFGGFSSAFYKAYDEAYPLEPSWQQSMDIANLYPLMVHVNLFGGGYPGSVKSILRRFS